MPAERKSRSGQFTTDVSSSGGRHMSTVEVLRKHFNRAPESGRVIETPKASKNIGGAVITVSKKTK